jgi:predicted TIM-barrel fold metal-dependent hydrolase
VNDTALHNGMFDYLTGLFGEDRVIFGSDWPNGNAVKHLDAIVKISRDFFSTKNRSFQEKYCWRNSIPAYSWIKRDSSQPSI